MVGLGIPEGRNEMRPQPSSNEIKRFGETFLTDILDWIADTMLPYDVWDEREIREWLSDYAGDYGYVEEGSE